MSILNINYNNKVSTYRYSKEDCAYILDQDITVGNWIIKRHIKMVYSKSRFKYNLDDYLELIIQDVCGIEKIHHFYYNNCCNVKDEEIRRQRNETIDSLDKFANEDLIFKSENWQEYTLRKLQFDLSKEVSKIIKEPREAIVEIESLITQYKGTL